MNRGLAALAVVAFSATAHGQDGPSDYPAALQPTEESAADPAPIGTRVGDPDLEWWPWLVTLPLLGATLAVDLAVPTDSPRWTGAGPIDRAFGSWTLDSIDGRRRAATASDVLLFSLAAAPVADAVLWNQIGTSRSRVTYRLLAADSMAFALQGLLSVSVKHLVRRARPYDGPCRLDATHDPACDSSSRYQAFTSGHAAAAFTGAALVCAHQRLRGRTPLGYVECGTSLVMASFVGALRMASERHYISDVIGGAVIGFLSGYLLPLLLYPRSLPPVRTVQPRAW